MSAFGFAGTEGVVTAEGDAEAPPGVEPQAARTSVEAATHAPNQARDRLRF